jgi:hypothetical protein
MHSFVKTKYWYLSHSNIPPRRSNLVPLYAGQQTSTFLCTHVGGRGRPKDDSTEGEKTQSLPCIIRCETFRFRLQKYRNGGQLSSKCFQLYYTCSDCWQSRSPLALSIFFPLLLWRFLSSQLFCVHYNWIHKSSLIVDGRLSCQLRYWECVSRSQVHEMLE